MLYIFNKNDELLKILNNYENFEYTEKLNNQNEVRIESPEPEYLIKDNKLGFFNKNDEFKLFLMDDIKEFKEVDSSTIFINCINDIYVLNNKIIEDKRVVNGSVNSALEKALENTEYEPGLIEQFENKDINFYFISSMKALNNIIETYNCEFTTRIIINPVTGRISNKFIDIKHRIGQDTGLRFTYDTNLTSIEKTPVSEVYNVLYGFGKSLETENNGYSRKLNFASVNNNKKYIENTESILKYGRKEGVFEDNNIDDPTVLLNKTRDKLQETKNRKYSYEVNVEDLSSFKGFEHYKYNIGDSIVIMDEEDNLVIEARIIAINNTNEEITLTLGHFQNSLFDEDIEDSFQDLKDKVDNIINSDKEINDNKYPNTLPNIPVVEAQGLFSSVILSWSYENKTYYTYEVFASKTKDFNPAQSNRIFEGKASSYLHEVKPSETWYYRVRAKNTHDKFTNFSSQVAATTKKINDGTQYFEELAIGHALIESLDMDKATIGKLKGQFIEAKNLLVIDGNNNKTLEIDSFGRVKLNVTELSVLSKEVETKESVKNIQAEIKVETNGIKQSVSALEQTTIDINGKFAGYVTNGKFSEYKQSAENFQFAIENRTTANILRNSAFASNRTLSEGWSTHAANVPNNNVAKIDVFGFGWEWSYKDAELNTLIIRDKNTWMMLGGEIGANQPVNLVVGEKYTFSMYCAAHRVNECYITIRGTKNSTWEWNTHKTLYSLPTGGSNTSNWMYVTITFTALRADTIIEFGIKGYTMEDPYMFVAKPMLNKGEIPAPYTGNSNEINKGVSTIDEKGLTVAHSSGSSASFNHDGSIWRDNLGREGIKINNGGMAFIDPNNKEWTGFMRTSQEGGSINGVTISTTDVGDYVSIGCSKVSSINDNWTSSAAITVENYDGNHGLAGLHLWSMKTMSRNDTLVHNHTSYIQEAGNIYMNKRYIFFNGYGHTGGTNWIGQSANSAGKLCLFSDNEIRLGYHKGNEEHSFIEFYEGAPYANSDSWFHLNFHNYNLYNANLVRSAMNAKTRTYVESKALFSVTDSTRYVYKKKEFKYDAKQDRYLLYLSIPSAYQFGEYNILNIVKYGKGDVWIAEEKEKSFILEADAAMKVNIEIDIEFNNTEVLKYNMQDNKTKMKDSASLEKEPLEQVITYTDAEIKPYWNLYKKQNNG